MNDDGQSHSPVVPAKPANKAVPAAAESVEERGLAKGNMDDPARSGHRAGIRTPRGLDRVRQVAVRNKGVRFTALFHHLTVELLREGFKALRREAAPGVDGTTWKAYGQEAAPGSVSSEAVAEGIHPQGGRAAAAARGGLTGGQDRPVGAGRGVERYLRARLPRLLTWVPPWTQPARC